MTTPPTTVRYRALAWLTLAAALAYLCRSPVGVAESTIRADLELTTEQSGWFLGVFFWTYAIFQVPSGWFSARFGTRVALTIFALAWSTATFATGVAPGFWLLIVAQLMMGTAQAGIFPASCNSIGHWMPLTQRALSCGVIAAGMQLGAILSSGLTGGLIAPLGWRWVYVLLAIPSLIWTVCFFFWFRDQPEQVTTVNTRELELIHKDSDLTQSQPGFAADEWTALLAIVHSPVVWWLCGQQVCRAAGYGFFASWFPTFLQQTRGVTIRASGLLQGLVLLGTLTGSLVGGVLTDWVWRRSKNLRLSRGGVGAAFLGACAVLILAAWFVEDVALAVALLALGAFFAALAGPCALAATIDIGGPRVPQVFGLMNMCGNLATAVCPVLVGKLFAWTANWNLVLVLFAGVYLVGAICWAFVNPHRSSGEVVR